MNICHEHHKDSASNRDPAEELLALRRLVKRLAESNRILSEQLETDLLTGLLNRRGLERILRRESRIAQRSGKPLSCAVVDLDNFKQINDWYGHVTGDEMLKAVAHRLQSSLRSSDYIARIGGDEFLVVMPDADLKIAIKVLQRCTECMSASPLLKSPEQIGMTISSGVCLISNLPATLELVLTETKQALRNSKDSGKNQVCSQMETPARTASLFEFSPFVDSFDDHPPPIPS
jgi:diguanylate cyclase (GGDEF)-like protein